MSANENEAAAGVLGFIAALAVIGLLALTASVSRCSMVIDIERDCQDFGKFESEGVAMKTPEHCSDDTINALVEKELLPVRAFATAMDAVDKLLTAPRRRMEYDRVPVGHDIGYRCYDGSKHDPDSAFQSGEYGDGLSENEAYSAWLRQDAENNPKPRPTRKIYSSGAREEPDDYGSVPEPEQDHGDDVDFDSDLENNDGR